MCGVIIMMNYVGLQWKKSLQCRSAKALSPIGTPSGGIRNNGVLLIYKIKIKS